MIRIHRHIEILLLKNDCVIVPGLGGFTASHVAARYEAGECLFIPPLRTLGFNLKLNINDSLLALSYSEAYDISYPEACKQIEDETNEIKQHIYNEGSYELNDIGTLYLNKNGNIEFSPCEAGILTPDLYSLSSFQMKRTGNKQYYEQHLTDNTKEKLKSSSKKTFQNTCVVYKSDIKYLLLRNTAAIILAMISFLILSNPINNNKGMMKMSNFSTKIIPDIINERYKNVTDKKNILIKIEKKNLENNDIVTDKDKEYIQTCKKIKNDNYYCIVLASRITKKNADNFVKQLEDKGLKQVQVLIEKDRYIKVIYGYFETKGEATNTLNSMRSNDLFNEAWVYKVEDVSR